MFTDEQAARIPSTSARSRVKSAAFEILVVLVARVHHHIYIYISFARSLARSHTRRASVALLVRERKTATIRKQRRGGRRVTGTSREREKRKRERESFIRRSGDRSPLNAAKESKREKHGVRTGDKDHEGGRLERPERRDVHAAIHNDETRRCAAQRGPSPRTLTSCL